MFGCTSCLAFLLHLLRRLQVKEFGCAVMSPSGVAAVVGNFNKFIVYAFSSKTGEWEETKSTVVPNLYNVTAVGWKADGSRVAIGSVCGGVDLYDACVKKLRFKGAYDFTYVSDSQVSTVDTAAPPAGLFSSEF